MPDQSAEAITLSESQLPITTAALLYTAPAGLVVTVRAVTLTNILTGAAATARLDHVPSGGTDGTTLEIFNESIAESTTVNLPLTGVGPVAVLQPGDKLYGLAGTVNAIDCSIIGSESPIE